MSSRENPQEIANESKASSPWRRGDLDSPVYAGAMKKMSRLIVVGAIFGFGLTGLAPAQASTLRSENLVLTLPDTVTVSGSEEGSASNSRKCSIKASLDSNPGTFIPLRAGAVVSLNDSTGFGIDNGYATANVEGLTHLDIVLVFKCGNGAGTATLKGPYTFKTTWTGMPGQPFAPDTPVNLIFGSSAQSISPVDTAKDVSKSELTLANEEIAVLKKENSELSKGMLELASKVASLNSRLEIALKSAESDLLKNMTSCFRKAKSIAISKKGTLPKMCMKL
jgi:hypothetical protein